MTNDGASQPEQLRRVISRFSIAVLVINGIVGAGIFGMPGKAANLTGAFSPIIFVICGVLMSTLMISFAQAASYFHGTGGPILYVRSSFGRFAGFQCGWILWVSRVLALAANANLLTTYLAALIFADGSNPEAFRIACITVMAAFFTYVNIVGVKTGMSAILAITFVKFIPLLVLCLVGLSFVTPETFSGMEIPSYENLGTAVLLVFYAFVGFESALVPAAEFKNPKRDIPRAMFATAAFASILYAVIQTVSYAAKPDLGSSEQPLAAAAEAMMGSFGLWMVSIGAVVSILGNYAAAVLYGPRITYALARDGTLPRILGKTHVNFRTPAASIVLYCGTGLALGIFGSFKELAVMSSLGRLVIYVLVLASIPRIVARHPDEEDALRLWGGFTMPVVALAISLWLMAQADLEAVYKTAILVAIGTVLYAGARRRSIT